MYRKKSLESRQPINSNEAADKSQDYTRSKRVIAGLAAASLAFGIASCDKEVASGAGSNEVSADEVIWGEDCYEHASVYAALDVSKKGIILNNLGFDAEDEGAYNDFSLLDSLYDNQERIVPLEGWSNIQMDERQVDMLVESIRQTPNYEEKTIGPLYVSVYTDELKDRGNNGIEIYEELVDEESGQKEFLPEVNTCIQQL